jgi:hypothetical protein
MQNLPGIFLRQLSAKTRLPNPDGMLNEIRTWIRFIFCMRPVSGGKSGWQRRHLMMTFHRAPSLFFCSKTPGRDERCCAVD